MLNNRISETSALNRGTHSREIATDSTLEAVSNCQKERRKCACYPHKRRHPWISDANQSKTTSHTHNESMMEREGERERNARIRNGRNVYQWKVKMTKASTTRERKRIKKIRRYSGPLPWFSSKAMPHVTVPLIERANKALFLSRRVNPCQRNSTFHLGMQSLNSFIILHTHQSSYSSLTGQSGYERMKIEIKQDNENRKNEAHGQRETRRHTLDVRVCRNASSRVLCWERRTRLLSIHIVQFLVQCYFDFIDKIFGIQVHAFFDTRRRGQRMKLVRER